MEWVSTFLLIVITILFVVLAWYQHQRIAALESASDYQVIRSLAKRVTILEQAHKGLANAITALQDSLIADCEDCGDDDDEEATPVSPPDGPTGGDGGSGNAPADALDDEERGNGGSGPLAMSGLLSADSGAGVAPAPVAYCAVCETGDFATREAARDHGAMAGHTIRFLVEFGEGETVNPWALVGAP